MAAAGAADQRRPTRRHPARGPQLGALAVLGVNVPSFTARIADSRRPDRLLHRNVRLLLVAPLAS